MPAQMDVDFVSSVNETALTMVKDSSPVICLPYSLVLGLDLSSKSTSMPLLPLVNRRLIQSL